MNTIEQAKNFKLNTEEGSWFDLWHTHLDWEGDGNHSLENRNKYLEAMFVLFERIDEQTKELGIPSNVWLLIDPDNSGDDSVYVHTPNPNPNSEFPYSFEGVTWGIEVPELFQSFVKEDYEVGISNYNGTMYWVRRLNET